LKGCRCVGQTTNKRRGGPMGISRRRTKACVKVRIKNQGNKIVKKMKIISFCKGPGEKQSHRKEVLTTELCKGGAESERGNRCTKGR